MTRFYVQIGPPDGEQIIANDMHFEDLPDLIAQITRRLLEYRAPGQCRCDPPPSRLLASSPPRCPTCNLEAK